MKKVMAIVLSVIFMLSLMITSFAGSYVRGYYRSNGTYVSPYYRSASDGYRYNNYSSWGNYKRNL
jgi:hypothetical protein